MDEGDNITVILLTEHQIGFEKRLLSIINLIGIMSFLILIAIYAFKDLWGVVDPSLILLSVVILILYIFLLKINSPNFFYSKTDKKGKTREIRVKEFWEFVLNNQDKIFIERTKTKKESYVIASFPATNFGAKLSTKMTWCGITLFEKNHEGRVTHLEGMPGFLFLKD